MGREIVFVVAGEARPEAKKTGRAFLAKDGKTVIQGHRYEKTDRRDWKADVRAAAFAAIGGTPLLEGPLVVTIIFIRPKTPSWPKNPCKGNWWPWALWKKPDVNNLVKPVEDSCSGVLWGDDKQIVGAEQWKVQGEKHLTLVRVREATRDELEYKRAAAEGVICELLSGALCSRQGEQDEWAAALVEAEGTLAQ